jgi:hypothetical protein
MPDDLNQKRTESRLVYEIMQELGKFGAVYRCNAGSVKLPDGRRFQALPAGFSDIMLIRPGGMARFVEVKTRYNKPSPPQEKFITRMILLGCKAGVAYSVADALEICGITES